MARYQYGGQALIEGVLMRGRNALAIALRHPDGSIVWAVERLDLGLRARRALRLPFLRGLVVLYDTLVTGTRWLVRSATVQALALEDAVSGRSDPGFGGGASNAAGGLLQSLAVGFGGPALCAAGDSRAGADRDSHAAPTPGSPSAGAEAVSTSHADPEARASSPSPQPVEGGLGKGYTVAVGGMLLLTLLVGVGVFFLMPLFLAQATVGRFDQGFGLQLSEGVIRVAIFIGYLLLVARAPDVRRTFQYHGAEHMSIHTLEAGEPLTTQAARKYPTAHPRCGTEFLVVVLIVSILAFAIVGKLPPLWLVVSRVILIPVIAAISYELLQLGARHRSHALVRWMWSPGIWVQAITTRLPTDDMIEVAIVSLERALVADGGDIPAGSAVLACRPLVPDPDGGITTAPAGAP
ncbi:MAG: DUF1385 domain-containing protein [Candidatus Limnocylindrales bacterium]|jgi:uncharacterized protein YqhQ